MDWHSYHFAHMLDAVIRTLGADIKPALPSEHHRQQVDMICVLLGRIAQMADTAADDLVAENRELETLLARAATPSSTAQSLREKIGVEVEVMKDDVTISYLAARNAALKLLLNEFINRAFATDSHDAAIEAAAIELLVRANDRRKPPLFLRGM